MTPLEIGAAIAAIICAIFAVLQYVKKNDSTAATSTTNSINGSSNHQQNTTVNNTSIGNNGTVYQSARDINVTSERQDR